MLTRDQKLEVIKAVYAARVRGDKQAVAEHLAPRARFEIAGDNANVPAVSFSAVTPMAAISALIDQFRFSDLEMLDSVVEGDKVAVHWAVTVTTAGKLPAKTQLFDLFRLDAEGRIVSLVQFADTALIRTLAL